MRCQLLHATFWIPVFVICVALSARADDLPSKSPSPHDSPIGRFLDHLFRNVAPQSGKEQNAPETPQPSEPADSRKPTEEIVPDAIDERATASREQQRDLVRAQRLLVQGEYTSALTVLQRLLEAREDTLVLDSDGQWVSLHVAAQQTLTQADEAVRRAYVERFGPLAHERLEFARRTGDPAVYAEVVTRYLHTPAGRSACLTLSRLMEDIGEPTEAAYWRNQLRTDGQTILPAASPDSKRPTGPDRAAQTDWKQPFGGPTHHGRFPESDPVLIERWSHPVAVRPAVTDQIADLVRDLVDNHRACIPAAIPLVISGRIVTRTFRGVSVLDADSGQLEWESIEGASIERLLSGDDVPRPGAEPAARTLRAVTPYTGTNADGHPLTGLLFRDGVYGLISSDGEQVFALEDHASLSYRQPGYFWGQQVQDDPFDRSWDSNTLVAYHLDGGQPRWRIGGVRRGEPFDLPLAGTLFLGPPVVDGNELFVIGERDATVYLFVLDRRTGQPLWSHAISESGAAIHQDLVRRWWPAQPAVGTGVIVCPTTTGWLVAVDRLQHRIRWSYRYIEARQKKVSSNRSRVASGGPLNTRWCPAAPILTPQFVVFAPAELPDPLYGDQPRLVCLDVLTGERVWWEEKRDRLYIAGLWKDRLLLAGKKSVEALDIATGKQVWETPLDLSAKEPSGRHHELGRTILGDPGFPSGRGVIAGDRFLLPLRSGQLWSLRAKTGEIEHTIALRSNDEPLGNLLIDRGRLISAGPFAVRCFEERSAITAPAVAAARQTATTLRAAELQFLDGDFASARELLTTLDDTQLSANQRTRARELLWDSLVELSQRDGEVGALSLTDLEAIAETEQEVLFVERRKADRLLEHGHLADAFDIIWKHAGVPRQAMIEEGHSSVRFDRWVAGQLRRILNESSDAERAAFEERIDEVVDASSERSETDRRWWAEVLRFHPAGWQLRRGLAEVALAERRLVAAEMFLLQILEEAETAELRRWAMESLSGLLLDQQRQLDFAKILKRYAINSPALEELREKYAHLLSPPSPRASAWSDGVWKLSRSPGSFNRSRFEPVLAIESDLPSIDRLTLRVEPNLHRLSIASLTGDPIWETPLNAQSQSFYNQTTGVTSVGNLVLVVHRGVLHALSLPDRELLWSRDFNLRSSSAGYVRGPSHVRQQELRPLSAFLWSAGLRQMQTPLGMLAVWQPGYVAYFGRHSLTVADPLTGDILWTRTGLAPRTMVHGTNDILYVIPPAPETAYALSSLDGSTIRMPRLDSIVSTSVAVTDDGLVQADSESTFSLFGWGQKTLQIRLVDPLSGRRLWSVPLPQGTRLARLGDTEILAVDPSGGVTLVDCRRGVSQSLGVVKPDDGKRIQRIFAMTDSDRIYIAFNGPPRPGSYSRSYQSVPTHGQFAALDRNGGLLWTVPVEDQNLVVDQFSQLRVLLFTAQRSERDGDVTSQQVFIQLRDKTTGTLLLDDSRYITGGNLREMDVDHSRQRIDLKTYNDRLRLEIDSK